MTPLVRPPAFRPVAECCVLVEFADTPSLQTEADIHALDRALAARPFPGFSEAVPAVVNLAVIFDPLLTSHVAVTRYLQGLLSHAPAGASPPRRHIARISYAGAPDLAEVAARTGLSEAQVIAAHLSAEFRVVMYGFAPGYAYLGGLPEALRLPRKPAPVRDVPAGSVIIAGSQCLITTLTLPTGWWIIGRSTARVLTGDPARPFLFEVGDLVRFRRDD